MKPLAFLGCLALSTGCAAALPPQAAVDFGCSEEQIDTESISPWFERATGCGQEDLYLYDHGQGRWISLRDRAAFELSCDKQDLKIILLDTVTFGVTGCNQKAVYKQLPYAGYVLDTVSESGEPPVPARKAADETEPEPSEPDNTPEPAPAPKPAPEPEPSPE